MSTFQDRIKQLRTEKGITQQDLSDKLGITKSILSKYENGHREPGREILNSLADFFDVSVDYLLGRTDRKEIYILEKKDLPDELQDLGIDYIGVAKEIKESGFSIEEIKELIEFAKKMRK